MRSVSDLSFCFFFNGERGLKILKLFEKKKLIINNVFIAKKFLKPHIIKSIPKKIKFKIINKLDQKIVYKSLAKTDIALSCGFPLIFSQTLLNLPSIGILNCHAGMLPKYKGGSPLNWQLINCEKKFGISVIKMNKKIDSGDIFSERKFYIKKNYDINDLHRIANKNFPKMTLEAINKIINKKKPKRVNKKGNIWKQRSENDSLFDFKTKTFHQADRFIKALQNPYPNAFFYFKKKKYKILKIKKTKNKLLPGTIFIKAGTINLGLKRSSIKAKFIIESK